MWKTYKKSSLIVYNASKESMISILGNTLIQICVFDRKKNPAISIASNSVIDRKDVQIYLWDRTLHLWWFEVQSCLKPLRLWSPLAQRLYSSLSLSLSLSLSNWDGSFEHPQHMRWLRYKGDNFQLLTLIWFRGQRSRFYLADLFVSTLVDPYMHTTAPEAKFWLDRPPSIFPHIFKLSFAY